jgi:hypothetical protein
MTLHDFMRWLHRQFIPCVRSCSKVAALYDSAQLEGGGSGSLLNPGERGKMNLRESCLERKPERNHWRATDVFFIATTK